MKKFFCLFGFLAALRFSTLPVYAAWSTTVGENLPVKPAYILAGMFTGAVAAVITVFVFKSRLKSVSFKSEANDYLINGSFNLTESKDIFIEKTVSKSLRTKQSIIPDELKKR